MKSGCCELPNRPEQVGVEGFPAAGEHSFDSPFSAAVVPRNNRQPTPQGPGSVRGKVSACCAWWWQWHWQWCEDNVAASSCVGGDRGVRREVEFCSTNKLVGVFEWKEQTFFKKCASIEAVFLNSLSVCAHWWDFFVGKTLYLYKYIPTTW